MNSGEPCWSCGDPARHSSALNVRLRREEGGGAFPGVIIVAYRKTKIRVPLCARCKKVWRPALRSRMLAMWSLTLGLILIPSALIMGGLMAFYYQSGKVFAIAAGVAVAIGGIAVAVGLPAYRAQDRHPEGLRHPHSHPRVVALTDSGFGILN
ncbi:hypothetical protein ACFYXC_20135 [Streptomyces sp. NPDC002701]|uniref:hypothetical protein n=1 Tax=Streptomyces sp. NPDC002701 TaxID=3364661 RepID=UPI00369A9F66